MPIKRTRLKIKTTSEFFERGRLIAQAADQGLPLTEASLLALGYSTAFKKDPFKTQTEKQKFLKPFTNLKVIDHI